MIKQTYDFCVVITTFNRYEMLKELLNDIKNYKQYKIFVLVFDDASTQSYDLSEYNVKHIQYVSNNGLKNFWKIINDTFKFCKNIQSEYYVFLQDDLRLKENFFEESVRIFEKIPDNKKICLELRTDQRTTRPNWTNVQPVVYDEYIHTQWTELDFICKYNFFERLNFQINPVPITRWDKNPHLSSGVGEQLSIRLFNLGLNMYHVSKSLIVHGNHESRLLPELRKVEKLITN